MKQAGLVQVQEYFWRWLFSAAQWHIPVSDHIEINLGWDAPKFVKMKNFDSGTYIAGSVNAGVTGYIGDMLFLSAYYEFNHSHNLIVNWTGGFGGAVGSQPSFLNGHSFGIRVGCQIKKTVINKNR